MERRKEQLQRTRVWLSKGPGSASFFPYSFPTYNFRNEQWGRFPKDTSSDSEVDFKIKDAGCYQA